MSFSFTEILLTIIAIAISVIAIKITFSFNLNEYLEYRDKKLKDKIKNYCTHAEIVDIDGKIEIQSTFVSPSGTLNWVCQRCGLQLLHLDKKKETKRLEYFLKNPKEFKKQESQFKKLIKKAGLL